MDALVIDGHPNPDSLSATIARSYATAHGAARLLALRDLDFDPHLRFGYRGHMRLEPDLADAKRALWAAKRVVVVTPMWWGSTPALLKGFFDRALLPGEEYGHSRLGLPVGHLKGRRGRLFVLADTPLLARPVIGVHAVAQVRRHTLGFCGISPVRVTRLLGVKDATETKIEDWIGRAAELGARDGAADSRRAAPTPRTEPFSDEDASAPLSSPADATSTVDLDPRVVA